MSDPFEPPNVEILAADSPVAPDLPLADPIARLRARIIDLVLLHVNVSVGSAIASMVPLVLELEVLDIARTTSPWEAILAIALQYLAGSPLAVPLLAYQWYLLATHGFTLGKRAFGIRIVRDDGEPIDLLRAVVLRNWVPAAFGALGGVVTVIDALLIFSEGHRTLHDRIAGTRVVVDARWSSRR